MDHKELDVWRKSMDLAEEVYQLSRDFPKKEIYGLASQIRRSAISVPSNIAEGAARKGDREFLQFLNIALGSLAELETQYLLSKRFGYVKNNVKVEELITSVRKWLLAPGNT